MRDQSLISIDDFMGLFDRGPNENCPLNYFIDCSNLEFVYRGFRTRGEFLATYTFSAIAGTILGLYVYPRLDGTQRRLILIRDSGGANPVKLYDIDHVANPFLVATYDTDVNSISTLVMFDRLYIAPLIDENQHGDGFVIDVYDGTNAARNAAGFAPVGATMTSSEPGAGNVEAGLHLFAVAFETPSGFITKMGPATWTQHTASGSKNVNLAGILTGPAGTVARHILATKVISSFSGDQENYELFKVPSGRIADNVTTTLTMDFFDTELVESADYLMDLRETIPAGPLFSIGNSMGVAGYREALTPASDKRSVALISQGNEVENFSEDEGLIVVKPGYGGNLYNGVDLNGTLYLFKDSMTLAIQPDPNTMPVNWYVSIVDSINGTGPFGIGTYVGLPYVFNGGVLVTTKVGLQFFDGTYTNLSDVIDERWQIATGKDFNRSVCVVDPIERRVYILFTADTGLPNTILAADFKLGYGADKVRWCPWTITNATMRTMMNLPDGQVQTIRNDNKIIKHLEGGIATTEVISSHAETFKARWTEAGYISQLVAMLLGAEGAGTLNLTLYNKDATLNEVLPTVALSAAPARLVKRLVSGFLSQMISLKMHTTGASNYMIVNTIKFFGNVQAQEYPE